jgi:hypothetical protein
MANNNKPRRSFSQMVFAAIALLVIITMILGAFRIV